MATLFSQKSAVDAAVYESRQKGRREGYAEIAYKLYKKGLSIKDIAETVKIPT